MNLHSGHPDTLTKSAITTAIDLAVGMILQNVKPTNSAGVELIDVLLGYAAVAAVRFDVSDEEFMRRAREMFAITLIDSAAVDAEDREAAS